SGMATLLSRQQFFRQEEVEIANEAYSNSGLRTQFSWNGLDYQIVNPYNIATSFDGITIRHELESDSGEYPGNSSMTNLVRCGGNAYCFSEDTFWSLNMATLRWNVVPIEANEIGIPLTSSMDTLRVVDPGSGLIDLIEYFTRHVQITRIQLDTVELQSTTDSSFEESEEENHQSTTVTNALIDQAEAKKKVIQDLREDDIKGCRSISRSCGICFCPSPSRRAAFVECGHLSCLACAIQMSDHKDTVICPFCRTKTKYVRIYEEKNREEEIEIDIDICDEIVVEKRREMPISRLNLILGRVV
ncbi:hypothetical protein PFISCL1PPCAC_17492, partial [Pristionchus fissidentatus]